MYTLQFFLPKNYALFKELPPPSDPPCGCRGIAEKTSGTFGRRLRRAAGLVGVTGIGPVTSSLSGTRSNQLSYTPRLFNAECGMHNAE